MSGLLQTLDDCGSPPLASRAPTLSKPTTLRTSDHKSMMAYTGLPLDIFGKVVLFATFASASFHMRIYIGRFLPTLSATTTSGYDQGDEKLVMRSNEYHFDATKRN